ncbi:MAG: Holliday junction branch migration protein RuvA [Candidatus Yonathbacteria bacterium CG17_big_fil_post_rev_8_21_14_2_50_46_19]|nr:MAG: Holliday junction DNA helicase RuvA [Candidatus Nomurabacteria bacterium CG1_02_47_685]PIP03410.1 MAG: Holliday junction branch migration protein RuvA [Candidatus Yonathbacteria bacterium CG23_combo_of_CG06-09_8_20_14_all_46_18]PIQ32261.1 MAG: Holliday junction branch migration protein RuvA [Candidatus Yonathbacteria bacterium CG17_big_fil_post_rev_8_21_14_2_50_46_19]
MIARISGNIVLKGERFLVIDCSGVGYKVYVSPETLRIAAQKREVSLWTYLAVRDDALNLYGFLHLAELELFEMLIGIPGIGPKSALGIMGVAPAETLKTAIAAGDTSYLTKVSGIGKKNAEKIVLELREKLGAIESEHATNNLRQESDVIEALKTLGYPTTEARDAAQKIPKDITNMSEKVKAALKLLGQK